MDISVAVNIALCILSFILAVISIIIVVLSLRQNSKMIESSTRPNISIYAGTTYFSSTTTYLIIKNFGSSTAIITDFNCDMDLSVCAYNENYVPFKNIVNLTLCPQQSVQFPVRIPKLHELTEYITFNFSYKSSTKSYEEKVVLNLSAYCDRVHLRANTKGEEVKAISFTLQDIAEKML